MSDKDELAIHIRQAAGEWDDKEVPVVMVVEEMRDATRSQAQEIEHLQEQRERLRSRNEELEAEVKRLQESRFALMDAYGAAVFELQRLGVKTVPLTPPLEGEPCPECDGKEGQLDEYGEPCDLCWGRGYVRSEPAEGERGENECRLFELKLSELQDAVAGLIDSYADVLHCECDHGDSMTPPVVCDVHAVLSLLPTDQIEALQGAIDASPCQHRDTAQRQDALLERLYGESVGRAMYSGTPNSILSAKCHDYNELRRALTRALAEPAVPEAVKMVARRMRATAEHEQKHAPLSDSKKVEAVRRGKAEALHFWTDELGRALAQHGEQRMVPVYVVPEDVEAQDLTCFTLHDHPPFGADFLTLFRAAPQPEHSQPDSGESSDG